MNKRSKSINLFLIDGDVKGRIKCTIANWTGLVFKIPRIQVEDSKNREELKQTGVYFLFGSADDSEVDKDNVYIGQAGLRANGEGLLFRINEHKNDVSKDYWNEAVVVTTSNNSFGPTEISYLENKLVMMAKHANRYEVKNNVNPNKGNITEEKKSELEEFIENLKLVIGTLGYKVFEDVINEDDTDKSEPILFYKVKNIEARCKRTTEGFVLLKGSQISEIIKTKTKDLKKSVTAQREKYKNDIKNNKLTHDILFNSPSGAAKFVSGTSVNGMICWKTKEGLTLQEITSKE